MQNEERSYKSHEASYATTKVDEDLLIYKNWFERNTTDLWRHLRMLSVLNPFLLHHKNAKWLTVGDGRFGSSATYILKKEGQAMASDIDIRLLKVAKEHHMINDYCYANAEKLPFPDNQFHYSYCKQAYHHFPRPILAVYEMLRVSQHAVIFTEPHDFVPAPITRRLLQKSKHALKKIFNKKIPHHDTGNYEEIGNYIYTISVREFEKIALGLGLPCIAFKKFHDHYEIGVENETLANKAPLYKKIKQKIFSQKLKTFLKIDNSNNIQMIVFKTTPDNEITTALEKDGYTITHFSKNPYQ